MPFYVLLVTTIMCNVNLIHCNLCCVCQLINKRKWRRWWWWWWWSRLLSRAYRAPSPKIRKHGTVWCIMMYKYWLLLRATAWGTASRITLHAADNNTILVSYELYRLNLNTHEGYTVSRKISRGNFRAEFRIVTTFLVGSAWCGLVSVVRVVTENRRRKMGVEGMVMVY